MLKKIKEQKDKLIFGGGAALTTALVSAAPVLAEDGDSISSTLTTAFTGGVTEIKTTLVAVIGAVMTLIVLKVAFRAGVSFFKSSATK